MAAFFMHVRTFKLLKGDFLSSFDVTDDDNDNDYDANPPFSHSLAQKTKGDFLHGVYPAFTLRLRCYQKYESERYAENFCRKKLYTSF